MNRHINILTALLAITLSSSVENAFAEMTGSQWLVKPGDTVYSIARTIFPDDTKKRVQLRKEIISGNPDVFHGNANLMTVGSQLTLPSFTIEQTAPKPIIEDVVEKQAKPDIEKQQVVIKENIEQITIMPDPEDIIGRVLVNVGEVKASNRGNIRDLSRHSKILKGDTLITAQQSQTQVRMKDGALVSLSPNTELRVAEYVFNGQEDGSESSILELLRGGFRTITGAIGKKNKQTYEVKTTVATIGIRGTHYGLMLCTAGSCQNNAESDYLQDGLYGGVVDGSVVINNQQGEFQFNNDQYFEVSSISATPIEKLKPPPIFKTRPIIPPKKPAPNNPQEQQASLENKTPQARQLVTQNAPRRLPMAFNASDPDLPKPPLQIQDQDSPVFNLPEPRKAPDGAGMVLAFNFNEPGFGIDGAAPSVIVAPVNNNEIYLTDYTFSNGSVASNIPFGVRESSVDLQEGTVVTHEVAMTTPDGNGAIIVPSSLGGNGTFGVNWGRWTGDFIVNENNLPLDNKDDFHFIYSDNLTSPTQLFNLGGIIAGANDISYTVNGGTLPTDHLGNVAAGLANVTMNVDFVAHNINFYRVNTTVNGQFYQAEANLVPFQDLVDNGSFEIMEAVTACLSGPCQGEASILFIGNQAGAAITSFNINEPDGTAGVSGTALMIR